MVSGLSREGTIFPQEVQGMAKQRSNSMYWKPAVITKIASEIIVDTEVWTSFFECTFKDGHTALIPVADAAERMRGHPASPKELAKVAVANLSLMADYGNAIPNEFPPPASYVNLFEKELEPFRSQHSEVRHELGNIPGYSMVIGRRALEEEVAKLRQANDFTHEATASAATTFTPSKPYIRHTDPEAKASEPFRE